MAYLSHLQTLFEGQLPDMGEQVRLDVDPRSGALLIHDPAGQSLIRAPLGGDGPDLGRLQHEDLSQPGDTVAFAFGGTSRTLDRATLDRLTAEPGEADAFLDGTAFYGNMVTLASFETGGQSYLCIARKSGSGVETYRVGTDGSLTPVQSLADTATSHLSAVTAMTAFESGGQTWLATASATENGISLYRVGTDGKMTLGASFGFDQQLPVTTPTAMTSVEVGGETYVLLTAFGTSSLTVLEATGGGLEFRDQLNDSLGTRFGGASVVETFIKGDMALVAVAGGDGGLSLMQLLPGGRLLHRETVVDGTDTALAQVSGMRFVEQADGGVELFVLSGRDGGLSRFALDDAALGITARGQNGSAGNDILTAADRGGALAGGDGADVLIDAAGQDTLSGGAGADVFILSPDEADDLIRDFNAAEDQLDLGGYDMVHDISALGYRMLSNGAEVTVAGDTLTILSHNGRSLSRAELEQSMNLAADHVLMPVALPRIGEDGDDTFEASRHADTVDGGRGYDTLSYRYAASGAEVNLGDSGSNAGAAAGHILTGIEGLIGSAFDDCLTGDGWGNNLVGAGGDDTIRGEGGSDWITPGAGSNMIDGGAGRDMVSFVDLEDTPGRTNLDYRLDIDLGAGIAVNHDGSETNWLSSIERVTGTIFADRVRGSAGDDEIRGLGDYDWMIGTTGADTYDGGTGRDMISYVDSATGVTVDLALGQGLAGLATGDSYASVERVTGSAHADLFYGDAGENDFRGLGGYDVFVGSAGGRERYDGGAGVDTVAYFLSTSGVEASLLRGYGSGGDAARDLYTSIENLGGTSHDDVLTGDHGRNQLRGLAGDDFIFGNGGIDYLTGGRGNDTIDGGAGSDYAVFSGSISAYSLLREGDRVTVEGADGTDLLIDVEYFRFDDETVDIWSL